MFKTDGIKNPWLKGLAIVGAVLIPGSLAFAGICVTVKIINGYRKTKAAEKAEDLTKKAETELTIIEKPKNRVELTKIA